MHSIKEKILAILRDQGSIPLKYREIGRRIGQKYPQAVKYNIEALIKSGLIVEQNGFIKLNSINTKNKDLLNLPFFGLVNCGEANIFTNDNAEGFIKISRKLLPSNSVRNYFILRASGNSMNRAKIGPGKKNINDGDFILVDKQKKNINDGDYIVSIIDDCANIKKFRKDSVSNIVQLLSESTDEYFPIMMHGEDKFYVAGKIIDVIKNYK